VLVALAGYQPALIDAVAGARSNTTPPTLYTATIVLAPVGLLIAAARVLDRLWRRGGRLFARVAGAAIGIYIWHLTALALCAAAIAAGVPVPTRLTPLWWATRPLWWATVLVVTAGFVMATGVVTRAGHEDPIPRHPRLAARSQAWRSVRLVPGWSASRDPDQCCSPCSAQRRSPPHGGCSDLRCHQRRRAACTGSPRPPRWTAVHTGGPVNLPRTHGFWVTNHLGNPNLRPLLRSSLGRRLGRRLAVLRDRGHRSGQVHELVVQYVRVGDVVWIVPGQPERKRWWRNMLAPWPVELWLAGTHVTGAAHVLREPTTPGRCRPRSAPITPRFRARNRVASPSGSTSYRRRRLMSREGDPTWSPCAAGVGPCPYRGLHGRVAW
jgi:hypothetical protein